MTRPDAPSDEPLLIVDERVTGATPEVLAAGVSPGMPRREAEALAPFATVMVRDPGDEARHFEPVVAVVEELVPRVEVVSPGLLFVPIAGAIRFYDGEGPLAARMAEELDRVCGGQRGGEALIGVADGPFAARWAAATASVGSPNLVEDTLSFLSGLDLSVLRESMGGEEMIHTFRWLGVATLGDLARLPRDALATRFGNPGILAHRLASGEDRPPDPREIPPETAVEMTFEDPLETLDAVAFAGRTLAERMLSRLRPLGLAPHTVTIAATAAGGATRERVWRSADPFTETGLVDRVWWQLKAWVENGRVPGGIERLSISPSDLSGEGRQLGLLSDESSHLEAERALSRAQALVGPDRVLQGRAQGGRMPAERVAWSRWGESGTEPERDSVAPWPGATPGPSPALVPPQPEPIEVEWDGGMPARVRLGSRWEPVLTWSGPWRLTGRWWAGERGVADRYQLVTSVGAFLCVVSEDKTYL
ncbi:MAG: DNA polymerase Y family protein, partial [Actinobacteria bacterium]|nr:DNA polymerase Y family protein [Actinomycetota bacterium]